MINDIRENRRTFKGLFDGVIASNAQGFTFALDEVLENSIKMIIEQAKSGGKLILIGNGGSASIASHMAIDFWKNAGIRALAFNDSSLLTCISNDYGYEHVFEKPIEMFGEPGDTLIAISSSGKSENILLGVKAARAKGTKVITLSGFDNDNPLRKLGDANFYVPVLEYGHVEVIHLALCHCLVDIIIKNKSRLMEETRRYE